MTSSTADYSSVSENPSVRITAEALAMNRARYSFAMRQAVGQDVLEVACGPGQGLGAIAQSARRLVAGDYTSTLLRQASTHYGALIPLVQLDAHHLPFRPATFDLVVLFEALYYLRLEAFLDECRGVLRPGGALLLCTANPEWSGFNPSPRSTRYYSARALRTLLEARGFQVRLFAGFRDQPTSQIGMGVRLLRRIAVALNLVPPTMHGKELLKRLFYGRLQPLPAELLDLEEVGEPVPLDDLSTAAGFKVIYAAATLPSVDRHVARISDPSASS